MYNFLYLRISKILSIESWKKLEAQVIKCSGETSTLPGGWVYESLKFYNELGSINKHYIDQFDNKLNIEAHYASTAPEIFSYFKKQSKPLDYIFLGIGSGGTAVGIQKYIDEHNYPTKVIVCDPIGGIILWFIFMVTMLNMLITI